MPWSAVVAALPSLLRPALRQAASRAAAGAPRRRARKLRSELRRAKAEAAAATAAMEAVAREAGAAARGAAAAARASVCHEALLIEELRQCDAMERSWRDPDGYVAAVHTEIDGVKKEHRAMAAAQQKARAADVGKQGPFGRATRGAPRGRLAEDCRSPGLPWALCVCPRRVPPGGGPDRM